MNPVAVILRAVQIVRGWGVKVTFEPGWERRGNGYLSRWVGVLVHHTGTPGVTGARPFPTRSVLRDGHAGLTGPLCNSGGPWDGSVHIVAAQAANHAGASGGRSMGPLPVSRLFNPLVFGHEIDYPGSTPMSSAQYRTAALWSRALLIALDEAGQIARFDAERVRLHYETSITGKWDAGYKPGTPINAAAFRRSVAAVPGSTKEEDDVSASEVWQFKVAAKGVQAQDRLYGMDAIQLPGLRAVANRVEAKLDGLTKLIADSTNDPDISADFIRQTFEEVVREHTPTEEENAAALYPMLAAMIREGVHQAVTEAVDDDNEALAQTIAERSVAIVADLLTPGE